MSYETFTKSVAPSAPAAGKVSLYVGTDGILRWINESGVISAPQPLDTGLTALAGLDAVSGLLEQTALDTYTKRLIGVANATDIPTRANADARYAATVHSHPESDVTNLVADLASKANKTVAGINNFSTAAQVLPAATRTYLAGSALAVPAGSALAVGTCLRWKFNLTKTAAGTAASTYDICVGVNGTTADVARVSFAKPAGTAVIDQGTIEIEATIRSIGATGIMVGNFTLTHNLSATGHATIPCVSVVTISAGFDTTVANLIVGICATTGASDAITVQMVQSQAWNL